MENKNKKDIDKDEESLIQKWIFRFLSVFFICGFCYLVIKIEFNSLKNNEQSRNSATSMLKELRMSTSNLKDAWKTLYYFHKTGDLMKIIRCPNLSSGNNDEGVKYDNLIMLYREDAKTRQNLGKKNIFEEHDEYKNIKCGGKVSINIGLKNEVYKHPNDFKNYTFKLGEEPIDLIKDFPFIKYSLTKIREGERATFIAMIADRNILKPKKQIIYEIEIPEMIENETIGLPFYSILNKVENEKYVVNHKAYCGAVVYYNYKIHDKNGKILKQVSSAEKIKIGSNELNFYVENLMMQMSAGDEYIVFLTREMIKENNIFTNDIVKNNDILFFNVKLLNVQQ